MIERMIEVNNFRKVYGKYTAVDDISFNIHQGEIFGLYHGVLPNYDLLVRPGLGVKRNVEFQKPEMLPVSRVVAQQ